MNKVVVNEYGVITGLAGTIGPLWRAITVENRLRGVMSLEDAYRSLASHNKKEVTDQQLHAASTDGDFCAPEDILIATKEGIVVTENAGSRADGIQMPGYQIEGIGTGRNPGITYIIAAVKADKALLNSAARTQQLLTEAIEAVSLLDTCVGGVVKTVVVR